MAQAIIRWLPMIKLCLSNQIAESTAQEFKLAGGNRVFVVRKGGNFYGYRNECPHLGWPLNMTPTGFLDIDQNHIRCVNHMAIFDIASGACISGPCTGAALQRETIIVKNDALWIDT